MRDGRLGKRATDEGTNAGRVGCGEFRGGRRHAGRVPYNIARRGTHPCPSDPPSLFELWRTRPAREGDPPSPKLWGPEVGRRIPHTYVVHYAQYNALHRRKPPLGALYCALWIGGKRLDRARRLHRTPPREGCAIGKSLARLPQTTAASRPTRLRRS